MAGWWCSCETWGAEKLSLVLTKLLQAKLRAPKIRLGGGQLYVQGATSTLQEACLNAALGGRGAGEELEQPLEGYS